VTRRHDAFQARLQHLWLPIDSEVIHCVTEIGVLGNVDRSLHTPLTPEPGPLAAPLFALPPVEVLKDVAVRFQRNRPRTSDLLWLFSK
jgi:hypothetical protein